MFRMESGSIYFPHPAHPAYPVHSMSLQQLQCEIVACRRCPRLVAWREGVALNPPKRFIGESYWAKPVPSFGDSEARLMIVGLAPAAHGSNRTGRIFTGDNSGVFLFASMYRTGYANQPSGARPDDGLQLRDAYIAATNRCAPPDNKPTTEEIANCRPFLWRELQLMPQVRVLLGLGKIGFDAVFETARALGLTDTKSRPRFSHGAEVKLSTRLTLLGTYHPSQQNTFTGRLTEPMLDAVFIRAKILGSEVHDSSDANT